ncbi:085L [Cherax quadricarinatus iridovirus]|uniref:Uncharacterized protein n=1 Tax=Shrimp hemocyte iridescent virus TaxID=2039780 RepID=A0A291B0Q6_9VIRU|nr:085L [Cherax quadricarinatus iridovirus]YP_010084819.1 hypothetical protein KM509_gp067 [Shrimp hemocyte iridescent virus]UPA43399.1 hypothetical protein 4TH000125 [Iridovirus CN01]ASZ85065.1 085L [Cherax quadricarinatus iridovirus]ATE87076.1 hypothetical protein [Shrimp hemocyte iridescent virus]UPA43475.1 hypothetical protein 3TG000042 [Iridovirus CN01]UPA43670.1 hypothetical protein 1DG000078 [Iridovirus CN01]
MASEIFFNTDNDLIVKLMEAFNIEAPKDKFQFVEESLILEYEELDIMDDFSKIDYVKILLFSRMFEIGDECIRGPVFIQPCNFDKRTYEDIDEFLDFINVDIMESVFADMCKGVSKIFSDGLITEDEKYSHVVYLTNKMNLFSKEDPYSEDEYDEIISVD